MHKTTHLIQRAVGDMISRGLKGILSLIPPPPHTHTHIQYAVNTTGREQQPPSSCSTRSMRRGQSYWKANGDQCYTCMCM